PAVVSTPELIAERQETERAVDPTSYLALVRQVNRLEDAANFEPHRTAPEAVPKIRAADPPRAAPLRPRDWDRVISLCSSGSLDDSPLAHRPRRPCSFRRPPFGSLDEGQLVVPTRRLTEHEKPQSTTLDDRRSG